MKNYTIDNYKVRIKEISTTSNYNISVQVLERNKGSIIHFSLLGGTILKTGVSDLECIKYALGVIEDKNILNLSFLG